MAQAFRVDHLPEVPLDAALEFFCHHVPQIRAVLETAEAVTVVLPPADHPHHAWRLAAVQELAREAAPHRRVNAVEGGGEAEVAQALEYLDRAPGVTGQLLVLDGAAMDFSAQ